MIRITLYWYRELDQPPLTWLMVVEILKPVLAGQSWQIKKHYIVVELALSISNPNEEWQFGHKLPFLALFPSLEYWVIVNPLYCYVMIGPLGRCEDSAWQPMRGRVWQCEVSGNSLSDQPEPALAWWGVKSHTGPGDKSHTSRQWGDHSVWLVIIISLLILRQTWCLYY